MPHSPLPCRHDALDDPCIHGIEVPAPPPPTASPTPSSFGEGRNQNHAYYSTHAPSVAASGASSHAALGTGLAGTTGWTAGASSPLPCRHDGLGAGASSPLPCRYDGLGAGALADGLPTDPHCPFVIRRRRNRNAYCCNSRPEQPPPIPPQPACAGTTGLRSFPAKAGQNPRRPPQAPPFVIPAKAGIQSLLLQARSEQCCTSGASSHAALGTGLRRYDGLDGWCGLVRWCRLLCRALTGWCAGLPGIEVPAPPPPPQAPPPRHSGEGRNQNPRLLFHAPSVLHVRCRRMGTGLRRYDRLTAGASSPLPCRHDGLGRWCPHQRGQSHRRPPQAPPFVIPAKAGIQNPRLLLQLTPRAVLHVRCLITRRTGYRPSPVRRAGRLVPLLRCLAGTTGWTLVPLLRCLAGMTRSMIRAFMASKCPPHRRPPQAPPLVIPAKAGIGPTPTIPTHAPSSRCTSGASSHAALGTGLRRYDGLDGWCLFAVALPVTGATNAARPPPTARSLESAPTVATRPEQCCVRSSSWVPALTGRLVGW